MGLHELAHQFDVGRVADLQQHDRQIAGYRVAPQPGLPAPVPGDDGGIGAQRGVRVSDGTGQAYVFYGAAEFSRASDIAILSSHKR
jgi:hypothetical protein